jgi:hypothetical protein
MGHCLKWGADVDTTQKCTIRLVSGVSALYLKIV